MKAIRTILIPFYLLGVVFYILVVALFTAIYTKYSVRFALLMLGCVGFGLWLARHIDKFELLN